MRPPDSVRGPAVRDESVTPDLAGRVRRRLAAADRERKHMRARQRRLSLAIAVLASLGLLLSLDPATSNLATQTLTWLLAAAAAWQATMRALLDGLAFVPPLSALCMVVAAVALWRRLTASGSRGVR